MSIPAAVIGGYLGAGKTTLVNHLLRHADGRKLAVLVNEFGELPIDADLIEADDGDMISIAGGCICCSYGSDLVSALMELPERMPNIDGLLIEASGVALPGAVVSALTLLPNYERASVFVIADAETVERQGHDKYLADTITRQLEDADVVLLNKVDLVDADVAASAEHWVKNEAPNALLVRTSRSDVPAAMILDWPTVSVERAHPHTSGHHQHAELDTFTTLNVTPLDGVPVDAVARCLSDPRSGLVRAKGFLQAADGTIHLLQVVGQRVELTLAPSAPRLGIVCIGPRDTIDIGFLKTCMRIV